MRQRRGPWLSGLILALIGSVWMIGQIFGAAIIGRELVPDPGMAPAGIPDISEDRFEIAAPTSAYTWRSLFVTF